MKLMLESVFISCASQSTNEEIVQGGGNFSWVTFRIFYFIFVPKDTEKIR